MNSVEKYIYRQYGTSLLFFVPAVLIYVVPVAFAVDRYGWHVLTLKSNSLIAASCIVGVLSAIGSLYAIINKTVTIGGTVPSQVIYSVVYLLCVLNSDGKSRVYSIMSDSAISSITFLILIVIVMNAHAMYLGWQWNRELQRKISDIEGITLASVPERVHISVSDKHKIKLKYTNDSQYPTREDAIQELESMKL